MPTGISPGGRPIDETPLSASKTDNWVAKRGGLPPYVRGVARGIAKKHGGPVTSNDIQIAIGVLKNWASGQGKVHPAVRAAAAAAIARWEAMKGSADLSNVYDDLSNAYGADDTTIDLDWASFDAARGLHPRVAAAKPPAGQKKQAAAQQNTGAVAGYDGPAMNADTVNAIRNFQKANGLPVTGNLDAKTLSMAQQYPAKVASAKAAVTAKKKADAAAKKTAAAQKKVANAKKAAVKKQAAAEKKAASTKTRAEKAAAAKAKKIATAKATLAKKQAAASAKNNTKAAANNAKTQALIAKENS